MNGGWLDIKLPQGLVDEFRRAAAGFYYSGFEDGFVAALVSVLVVAVAYLLIRADLKSKP